MTNPLPEAPKRLGKYEIVEKIGEGGYSLVFRGFDPLIKRHVAIKSCATSQREIRERFHREAEIAGNLDHPNIVRVYDLFLEDETPYLVQELLEGEDLDDRIDRRDLTSFGERLYLLIQIARGLDYAHRRGVIHRDVKPANVRVLEDGTIKILDFGIAQLVHYNSDLTQQGMAVGTAAYLAPEQIRGEKASPATDIFSFGVLAYELLTYVRPFGRDTISETFYQTLNHDPPPLTAHWADCPPDLVELIQRCLHKDPTQRFRTCGEVLGQLEAARDRMREDWTPAANPARTQLLPAIDLPLGDSAPSPAAAELSLGDTRSIPIRPQRRSTSQVDLPLRDRPRGIRIAGSGRRRRRPWRWLPVLLALGLALAAWRWLPVDEVESWLPAWSDLRQLVAAPPSPAEGATAPPAEAPSSSGPDDRPSPTSSQATEVPGASVPEPSSDPDDSETPPEPTEAPALNAAPAPAAISFEGVWSSDIQLSIDGAPPITLGRARVIQMEPGDHSLTFSVESRDFRSSETLRIRVEAGESKRIPVPIAPPGRLTIQAHLGSPQGLVRIGGQRLLRPTPLRGLPIAPGAHRLTLFDQDDRSTPRLSTVVDVRSGHEAIVTFDLEGTRQPHVREKKIRR